MSSGQSRQSSSAANLKQLKKQRRNQFRISDFVQKRQWMGGRFTPTSNPPDVNYQPWNHVTLVFFDTYSQGSQEFKVQDLIERLKSQLDPTKRGFKPGKGNDGLIVQIRTHVITAWNLTGKVISLSVTDFLNIRSAQGNREQLCGLVDAGTTLHTPAVGYRFPSAFRQKVLRNDDIMRDIVLFTISAGSTDTICVHFSIDYKFDGPVIPPTAELAEALLLKELSTVSTSASTSAQKLIGMDKVLERLDVIGQKAAEIQQQGYKEKVINGVKHLATIVTALAADNSDDDIIRSFEQLEIAGFPPL